MSCALIKIDTIIKCTFPFNFILANIYWAPTMSLVLFHHEGYNSDWKLCSALGIRLERKRYHLN